LARKPLLGCSFLIPVRRDQNLSDGRLHRQATWSWLQERVHQFGGATVARELYEGWYVDPDTQEPLKDLCRKYFVALPRRELGALRALLREACSKFHQKCLYLSVAGHVEFVGGPTRETD
jgi:hypothetical protein